MTFKEGVFWEKYGIEPESVLGRTVVALKESDAQASNYIAVQTARLLQKRGLLKAEPQVEDFGDSSQ